MGEGSFPKVGYLRHHLLLPGHRAPPVPFSPGIPLGQTQGPSLPGLGLSEKKAQCFPSTQALSFPSPGPRSARASASGCMCEVYPTYLPVPESVRLLPPCPKSETPILGSRPWVFVVPSGASNPSCCSAFRGLALCPPIAASASPAHSSDTLQDTVVPLLSTQLCNSSCVYSGALTPRMLCAGYLDGRADACQVRGWAGPAGSRGPREWAAR